MLQPIPESVLYPTWERLDAEADPKWRRSIEFGAGSVRDCPERWTDLGDGRWEIVSPQSGSVYVTSREKCECPAWTKAERAKLELVSQGKEEQAARIEARVCYHRGGVVVLEALKAEGHIVELAPRPAPVDVH